MTPRIENEARIDVLAVMDELAGGRCDERGGSRNALCGVWSWKCDRCASVAEARAAVAELIAAASELLDTCQIVVLRNGERNALARFESALIRCGGAA